MNDKIVVGRTEYTVTVVVGDEHPEIAYELRGPRGAHYGLLRNQPNPSMLFAIHMRRFGVVRAMPWFTDRNGILEVA
jgi:hypothetical protein